MENEYERSEFYAELGGDLIADKFKWILEEGIAIDFLSSSKSPSAGKDKVKCGDCTLVRGKWKAYCPFDFLITVYEPNIMNFSKKQIEILLEHELNHVGKDEKGKLYVKPHDVEDFYSIIDEYGLKWAGD